MFYIPHVSSELQLIQGNPKANYRTIRGRTQYQQNLDPEQPWVAVDSLTRDIVNPNVEQPEPGRLVLHAGISRFGHASYWYYDDLPRLYQRVTIATVIFAIIATPLSLCCFIPALEHLKKAERSVQEDKVSQAREHCAWFNQCFLLGIVWVVIFCALAFAILFTVIVVLAVSLHP